jgi:hypothetical protein
VAGSAAVGCGRQNSHPVDVTLASLAHYQDAYQGKLVRTEGVVGMFQAPLHYWIEDNQANRVALEPADRAAPLVGLEVQVVGRFHSDDRTGRVIHINEIAPSAPSSLPRPGGR